MNLLDDYFPDWDDEANAGPNFLSDRKSAVNWAKNVLVNPKDYLILDTETTGLSATDEIIQIAIIDLEDKFSYWSYIYPTCPIHPGAQAVHGITLEKIQAAYSFPEIYPEIKKIIEGKKVLIYNSSFDVKKLNYQICLHNLDFIDFTAECVMGWYSQFVGDWNDYYQNYRWQPLPGGDHTALGDAKATLAVIKRIAEADEPRTTD